MKWSSFLSQALSFEEAIKEAGKSVTASLYGLSSGAIVPKEVDFAAVFVSEGWESRYLDLLKVLRPSLSAKVLIGCSGGGIIGGGEEVEHQPAISINAALLPGVKLYPFHLENQELPDLDAGPEVWRKVVGVPDGESPNFILLADPFSFQIESFVLGLDYAFPASVKIGGLASGANTSGRNVLYLNDKIYKSGIVGVALCGNIVLDTVIAHGCRPIGKPMMITGCDGNLLLELDRKMPIQVLQELFQTLSVRDKRLLTDSLFLGIVTDPFKKEYSLGDFLIRNLIGADMRRGILAVGANLRIGQTVQFHLRDPETSEENLSLMLEQYLIKAKSELPRGALLFSCLGRGEYLYGTASHDSKMFMDAIGHIPLGGFFCNGEIGPVGQNTYLHGYTSCFAIFKDPLKI